MIKRISIYTGLVAFGIIVLVGFLNHLNWFTILIRGLIGFFVFYIGTGILGFIGAQSILHQEMVKAKERLRQQEMEEKEKNK